HLINLSNRLRRIIRLLGLATLRLHIYENVQQHNQRKAKQPERSCFSSYSHNCTVLKLHMLGKVYLFGSSGSTKGNSSSRPGINPKSAASCSRSSWFNPLGCFDLTRFFA